jgi:hypothetical protein
VSRLRGCLAGAAALAAASASFGSNGFHREAAHGVRVTVPAGWARLRPAGDGRVTDPRTLLVVGTRGVGPKPSRCQVAAYRIPPGGAVVVILGWRSVRSGGAGAAAPGRGPLGRLTHVRRPSFECFDGRGAAASVVLDRTAFQVNVLVGDRASRRVVEDALAVGRSFALTTIATPAALPAARGWHMGTARIRNASCPRCVQADSWASTVPYRDAPNDFPHRTMAALGRDDVIVRVTRSWEPSAPNWERARRPLRIRRSRVRTSFEGDTTHGRVSLWTGSTWRAGSYVSVDVFFGSPAPSPAVIAAAQQELDGARFARWSIRQ